MLKSFLSLLLVAPLLLFAQQKINIIPQPVNLQLKEGVFIIDANTGINFTTTDSELQAAALFLSSSIKNVSGYNLTINKSKAKNIQLRRIKNEIIGKEGYQLHVSSSSIIIAANTREGIVYGIQSLLQTLPQVRTNAVLSVPAMEVTDYPRFAWRGMHLDVSRHFFSPEMVKEYINLLASYKINTFHWHLVDDQGWRIEIKKYPKLTGVGAWRVDQTDKVWGDRPQAKPGEEPTYGGFYTQEQLKEIVVYAKERAVTIVPEIEMPGHVASAISAYPELSCTQKPQLSLTGGNYTGMSSNYCAGNDKVFSFLQDVLTEVFNIFPSAYIHLGGDEVDKSPWKTCSRCQARIKDEHLKNEEELQSYFMKRMERFLISKGRKMIGWDEILEGGLAPEATVMSWRGESGGIQAARMHHKVVMTPGSPLYFDTYQAGPEGEPLSIGGFNTLKKVYGYEPIPAELNAEEANYVLGAQANVWTEYITTAEHLEYMVLPRMLALAEVVWTPKEKKNWDNFNQRLQQHFKGFEQRGLHFSPGNFTVDIKPSVQDGKLTVHLSTEILNGEIYYTTDGSLPTAASKKYSSSMIIDSSIVLKAATVKNGKVLGVKPAEQSFVMHRAIAAPVVYTNPVSKYYMADGPNSITDGVRGTKAVGKYWHGFSGKDVIATVDLGSEKSIEKITMGFLQNYRDWIFMPQWVKFEVSVDSKNFTEIKTVNNPVSVDEKEATIKDFSASFPQQKVRTIRVTAKSTVCPPGHSGAGQPAWIFTDELIVN